MASNREILKNFVVIEGIDGAGTSTQSALLHQAMQAFGYQAIASCEPQKAEIGTLIRQILQGKIKVDAWTMALLFAADRQEHIFGNNGVVQAINSGKWVISDRYFPSSLAYQGLSSDPEQVWQLNQKFPLPSHLIFADLAIEVSAERRKKRDIAPEIYENDEFLNKVALRYRELMKKIETLYPLVSILRLDGSQDIQSQHRQICTFLDITPIQ